MSRTPTNIGTPVEPLPGIIGSGRAMMEVARVTRQVARAKRRSERLVKIRKLTRPPVSSAIRGAIFSQAVLTKFAPIASRVSNAR